MGTLGWVMLTFGSGFLGFRTGGAAEWGLMMAGVILVVLGVWAVLRGRRHTRPVLRSIQGLPPDERLVVFLRAFSDDAGFSRVAALRWFRLLFTMMLPTPAHLRTEEDQVGRAVTPFGRMVALGRPTDRLPRLGADRRYASDGDWQIEVLAALERATLVLLVAGAGRSLAWEVDQVVGRSDPTRVVCVVSRNRRQYEHFRASLGSRFPRGLPAYPSARLRHYLLRGRYVRAVIWFEEDWTPHWEMLDGRFPLAGVARRTQRALPRALRKVYQRAGVPARLKPTARRPWAVKVSVPLIAVFWLAPVVWLLLVAFAVGTLPEQQGMDLAAPGETSNLPSPEETVRAALSGWGVWLWGALVAVCGYRVWVGGPYVIMMARLQGVFFPVFLVAFVVSLLSGGELSDSPENSEYHGGGSELSGKETLVFILLLVVALFVVDLGWLVYASLALLVVALLGTLVAALLLLRHDVQSWIDARL